MMDPPINVAQGPISLLYTIPEASYKNQTDAGGKFDPDKQIKRWTDAWADTKGDDQNPDLEGNPTILYFSYRIDPKTSTVVPFQFRLSIAQAKAINIPPPNDTRPQFKPEIPFPCRLIDPKTETFAIEIGGVIVVRNIELWNKQQQQSDHSGFTIEDRRLLQAIYDKVLGKTS